MAQNLTKLDIAKPGFPTCAQAELWGGKIYHPKNRFARERVGGAKYYRNYCNGLTTCAWMDLFKLPYYKKALGFSAQYVRASEGVGGSDAGK